MKMSLTSLFLLSLLSAFAQNPVMLKDCNPAGSSWTKSFKALPDGRFVFVATDSAFGEELWISDGTEAGTTRISDLNAGSGNSQPEHATFFNNSIFLSGVGTINGGELWVTDGTLAGTRQFQDICTGTCSSIMPGYAYFNFWEFQGKLFFPALQKVIGYELCYITDTSTVVQLLKDINSGNSNPIVLGVENNKIWFLASDNTHGQELWTSDGTASGTQMVKDIYAGAQTSYIEGSIFFNNKLVFTARDSAHGREIWISDGTDAGTQMLADITPGTAGFTLANFPYVITQNRLVLTGLTANFGMEPYVTDGTPGGTGLLKDINPGSSSSEAVGFTIYHGKTYFIATTDAEGQELWVTDGTEAGTLLLKDINSGNFGSSPGPFVIYNDKLYFSADDGVHGRELWTSDGTASGTKMVTDFNPGSFDFAPFYLTVYNGKLYCIGNNIGSSTNLQLFVYNSATDSIQLVSPNGNPNSNALLDGSTSSSGLRVINGSLYFNAAYTSAGVEPYVITDYPAGVSNMADDVALHVFPNPANSLINISTSSPLLELQVFDYSGRLVLHTYPSGSRNITLKIDELANGMYLLKAITEVGVKAVPFTVHK